MPKNYGDTKLRVDVLTFSEILPKPKQHHATNNADASLEVFHQFVGRMEWRIWRLAMQAALMLQVRHVMQVNHLKDQK